MEKVKGVLPCGPCQALGAGAAVAAPVATQLGSFFKLRASLCRQLPGLQPDRFSVAAGIRACEHGQHWQLALQLLHGRVSQMRIERIEVASLTLS